MELAADRTIVLDVPHIGLLTLRGLPMAQLVALCRTNVQGDGKALDLIVAGTVEPKQNRASLRASVKRAGNDQHLMPVVGAILDLSGAKEAILGQPGNPAALKPYAYR